MITLHLENDFLRIAVHPEEGGRVASICNQVSGTEFLLQSADGRDFLEPGMHAQFKDGPCGGIEECLPSVGSCDRETEGGAVPDHGDFWQLPWTVEEASASILRLHATGFSRPLYFSKQLRLQQSSLYIDYAVTNNSDQPVSLLYACHPLLAVEEGDVIVLPPEVHKLRLHSSRNQRLGIGAEQIAWPHSSHGDLSSIPARDTGIAEMLYTSRLQQGCCGLYRASSRQGIRLHFDTARLPYLGLWLCYSGWPEQEHLPKQYAVALEPTTAAHGTLKQAQQAGEATYLDAGQSMEWQIRFEISGPHAGLKDFQHTVGSL